MFFKWLHAPGHAGSVTEDVVSLAIKTQALVIDWSEMYWNTDDLLKHGRGYRHFIGAKKKPDSRGRIPNYDVVISTREDAEILHQEEFFVSAAFLPNVKYMPQRWGKAMVLEYQGVRILVVIWHPHPNPFRWLRVVKPMYTRSVRRVQAVQERLEYEYDPEVTLNGGDLQLGVGKDWLYPNQLANRLKMSWKRRHIDWQMFKGLGWRSDAFDPLNPARVNKGMDHMWTVLKLKKEA